MDGIAITRVLEDENCYAGMDPAFAQEYPAIENPDENFDIREEDIVRMIALNEGHFMESPPPPPVPSPDLGSPNFKHTVKLTPSTVHPSLKRRAYIKRANRVLSPSLDIDNGEHEEKEDLTEMQEGDEMDYDDEKTPDSSVKNIRPRLKAEERQIIRKIKLLKLQHKALRKDLNRKKKLFEKETKRLKKSHMKLNRELQRKVLLLRRMEEDAGVKRRGRRVGSGLKLWRELGLGADKGDLSSDSGASEVQDQPTLPLVTRFGRQRKVKSNLKEYYVHSKAARFVYTGGLSSAGTSQLPDPPPVPVACKKPPQSTPAVLGSDGLPLPKRRRGRPRKEGVCRISEPPTGLAPYPTSVDAALADCDTTTPSIETLQSSIKADSSDASLSPGDKSSEETANMRAAPSKKARFKVIRKSGGIRRVDLPKRKTKPSEAELTELRTVWNDFVEKPETTPKIDCDKQLEGVDESQLEEAVPGSSEEVLGETATDTKEDDNVNNEVSMDKNSLVSIDGIQLKETTCGENKVASSCTIQLNAGDSVACEGPEKLLDDENTPLAFLSEAVDDRDSSLAVGRRVRQSSRGSDSASPATTKPLREKDLNADVSNDSTIPLAPEPVKKIRRELVVVVQRCVLKGSSEVKESPAEEEKPKNQSVDGRVRKLSVERQQPRKRSRSLSETSFERECEPTFAISTDDSEDEVFRPHVSRNSLRLAGRADRERQKCRGLTPLRVLDTPDEPDEPIDSYKKKNQAPEETVIGALSERDANGHRLSGRIRGVKLEESHMVSSDLAEVKKKQEVSNLSRAQASSEKVLPPVLKHVRRPSARVKEQLANSQVTPEPELEIKFEGVNRASVVKSTTRSSRRQHGGQKEEPDSGSQHTSLEEEETETLTQSGRSRLGRTNKKRPSDSRPMPPEEEKKEKNKSIESSAAASRMEERSSVKVQKGQVVNVPPTPGITGACEKSKVESEEVNPGSDSVVEISKAEVREEKRPKRNKKDLARKSRPMKKKLRTQLQQPDGDGNREKFSQVATPDEKNDANVTSGTQNAESLKEPNLTLGRRRSVREVRYTRKFAEMIQEIHRQEVPGCDTYSHLLKRGTCTAPETFQNKVEALVERFECSWVPGNLVWARFTNMPFWPSIVIQDPFSSDEYSKVKTLAGAPQLFVHVQFLHEQGRRAWTPALYLMSFLGLANFRTLEASLPPSNAQEDKMQEAYRNAFQISERLTKTWHEAVKKGEMLLRKPEAQRLSYTRRREPMERYGDCSLVDEEIADVELTEVPTAPPVPVEVPPKPKTSRSRKPKTVVPSKEAKKRRRGLSSAAEIPIPKKAKRKRDELSRERAGSVASDSSSAFEKESVHSVMSLEEFSREVKRAKNFMFRGVGNEKICELCLGVKNEPTYQCSGICFGYFHASCVSKLSRASTTSPKKQKAAPLPDDWLCSHCQRGQNPCFICKEASGTRQMCLTAGCGKFYHSKCLKLFPQTKFNRGKRKEAGLQLDPAGNNEDPLPLEILSCARHTCHTCCSDNPAEAAVLSLDKLVRCVKCATSYHSANFCLPAGTEILTTSTILCGKHFEPGPNKSAYHFNINWCFICTRGGSLICCDSCPSSIHPECLKIKPPEGSYICEECESGRFPLHGEVVWVKLGCYRWWPSRVLYPHEIPLNILNMSRRQCEFVVMFYGTHDHRWVNRGRVYLYHEGDALANFRIKKGLDGPFQKAVREAAEEFARRKEAMTASQCNGPVRAKPAPYAKIRGNKYTAKGAGVNGGQTEPPVCDCKPSDEEPCGAGSNCLNRVLMIECHPARCQAGPLCSNRRFEKRQYPPLKIIKTRDRGWGLLSTVDLVKGQFIIEYVGEVVDDEELRERMRIKQDAKDCNYYFLRLDTTRVIDAGPMGNLARFMNHSCEPNCETQKWTVNGSTRIGIFAREDIPRGTELTFNYDMDCSGGKSACCCGSSVCSGFIGDAAKSKKQEEEPGKKKSKRKTKKEKKKIERLSSKVTESMCFRCDQGGELMVCDAAGCARVVHLQCAGLSEWPNDVWFCPRHLCSLCGQKTKQNCIECGVAYCSRHTAGYIYTSEAGELYCNLHISLGGKQESSSRPSSYLKRTDGAETPSAVSISDEVASVMGANGAPELDSDFPTGDSDSVPTADSDFVPAMDSDFTDVDSNTPRVLWDPDGHEIQIQPDSMKNGNENSPSKKRKKRTNIPRSKIFEADRSSMN